MWDRHRLDLYCLSDLLMSRTISLLLTTNTSVRWFTCTNLQTEHHKSIHLIMEMLSSSFIFELTVDTLKITCPSTGTLFLVKDPLPLLITVTTTTIHALMLRKVLLYLRDIESEMCTTCILDISLRDVRKKRIDPDRKSLSGIMNFIHVTFGCLIGNSFKINLCVSQSYITP